jgi:hypothetical protein
MMTVVISPASAVAAATIIHSRIGFEAAGRGVTAETDIAFS